MHPSIPPRPAQGPPLSSVTYTFTGTTVAPGTDAEILDRLMKSEEYKAFREDTKAITSFSVEMFKLYSGAVIAVATGVLVGSLSVVSRQGTLRLGLQLDDWMVVGPHHSGGGVCLH